MAQPENLPQYDESHFRHLELQRLHASSIGDAYQSYANTLQLLRASHDAYYEAPHVKSRELAYKSALFNMESAKAQIAELKDISYQVGLTEWMP